MAISRYASRLLKAHLAREPVDAWPAAADGTCGVLLLVDISGSTSMTERSAERGERGAEELGGLLDRYFGTVFSVIEAHGGDVVRIDGDAVLAAWHEDIPATQAGLRALAAAFALREGFVDAHASEGVRVDHRLALARGPLEPVLLRRAGERGFLVLTGQVLHELAAASRAGSAGAVVATRAFAESIQPWCAMRAVNDGLFELTPSSLPAWECPAAGPGDNASDEYLRDFVPRVVLERSTDARWLPEFRTVTMGYAHLSDAPAGAPCAAWLEDTLDIIAQESAGLRLPVTSFGLQDKGWVAVFAAGVPHHAQDHGATRVMEAARRMHARLAAAGRQVSIGIASGCVFCGDVGSERRREYLMTGPTMHRAARIMERASGAILYHDSTARAAGRHVRPSAPLQLRVKGCDEPLTVYRLETDTLEPVAPLHLGATLHGRDDAVARIQEWIRGLDRGRGTVLAIEAEAGAGKSHLLDVLAGHAAASGCTVLRTAASPLEQTTAYFSWRALLAQLLARGPEDVAAAPEVHARRIAELLAGHPLEPKAGLLEDIMALGLRGPGLAAEMRDTARHAGIEGLVGYFVEVLAAGRPVVVVADDAHWLDDASARLLLALLRRGHLAVAAGARPRDPGSFTPHAFELLGAASPLLELPRLSAESVERVVCDALDARALPEHLVRFLTERSDGLPFHAQQLALALRDGGSIETHGGRCRVVASNLDSGSLGSLADVIMGRVDRLDHAHQQAVKVASAIGRRFDLALLSASGVIDASEARLASILEDLAGAGILQRAADADHGAYVFRHALIQEAAYARLTYEDQRRVIHERIAALLLERHAGRLEPHYSELARHFEHAGRPREAIVYSERAAAAALERYDAHDALSRLDRIAELEARHQVALPARQRAQLERMRGDAEHALSRFDRAHPHYLASARLAGLRVPARPAGTVAGIAVELGRQLMHRCAFVPPVWDARARNRHQLAAHIHTRLAEQAYFEGDLLAILHGTLASLNGAERVRSVQEVVEGYGALAIGLGTARLHPLARFYSARSSAVARARGATREMGMACLFGAVYHFAAGCLDQAEAHAREGAEMFLRIDDRFRHQSCTTLRAQVAIARGRFEEAEALLRAFGEEAQYVENGAVRAWFLTGLVLLDLLLGRPPAPAIARLASARDERLHRGERLLCDGLEAAAWLESGDPARAQRCAEAALASMRERPPTLGIAYVSVWATARVLLDAAARAPATGRYAALAKAREACAAARSFGGKTVIARPRARLLSAELADLEGDRAGARREAARAATLARTLAMPVEEALALSMTAPAEGRALFATLGARPWLRAAAACAERAGEGEVEAFGR